MKTLHIFTTGVLLLSVALLTAVIPQKCWPTPVQATEHHHQVKDLLDRYQKDDFSIVEEYESAYCYITPPAGAYLWGEYVYLLRQEPADPTAVAAYVTITAYIEYVPAEKGYRCSGTEVMEEFFY